MSSDRSFRLASVYRSARAALPVLAEVEGAIDAINTGVTPFPDHRLEALQSAHTRTSGQVLPKRWRQLLRAAARCNELPAPGELVAAGSLPHVWPYVRAAEHDLPWALAVVLDECFTERDWIATGTTRIVFTDGPDRVLKVPFTPAGVIGNKIEADAAEHMSRLPVAPCELVAHHGLPDDLPLLSMARVQIPVVADVDQLPDWAGEVDDRQLGLLHGQWVVYDLGDDASAQHSHLLSPREIY